MGQGVLMESSLEGAPPARSGADAGFISVVVPVVERADDLVALYQSFRPSWRREAASTSSSSCSTAGSPLRRDSRH
jgi:hypothetical protein